MRFCFVNMNHFTTDDTLIETVFLRLRMEIFPFTKLIFLWEDLGKTSPIIRAHISLLTPERLATIKVFINPLLCTTVCCLFCWEYIIPRANTIPLLQQNTYPINSAHLAT